MKTRPDPPYVLAIDIGTSAVKAGIFDRQRTRGRRNGRDGTPPAAFGSGRHIRGTGRSDILLATEQAVDGVLAAAGSLGLEVAAVAADSMAGTMLGVDDAGLPRHTRLHVCGYAQRIRRSVSYSPTSTYPLSINGQGVPSTLPTGRRGCCGCGVPTRSGPLESGAGRTCPPGSTQDGSTRETSRPATRFHPGAGC